MRQSLLILMTGVALGAWTANGVAQPQMDLGWHAYASGYGTRDDVPTRLFPVQHGPPQKGVGEEWSTRDGRARLAVFALRNVYHDTPESYLRRYLTDPPSQ